MKTITLHLAVSPVVMEEGYRSPDLVSIPINTDALRRLSALSHTLRVMKLHSASFDLDEHQLLTHENVTWLLDPDNCEPDCAPTGSLIGHLFVNNESSPRIWFETRVRHQEVLATTSGVNLSDVLAAADAGDTNFYGKYFYGKVITAEDVTAGLPLHDDAVVLAPDPTR